jgi:hypothetical protein
MEIAIDASILLRSIAEDVEQPDHVARIQFYLPAWTAKMSAQYRAGTHTLTGDTREGLHWLPVKKTKQTKKAKQA